MILLAAGVVAASILIHAYITHKDSLAMSTNTDNLAAAANALDTSVAALTTQVATTTAEIAALKAPDGTAPRNAALDDPLRDPAEATPPGPQMGAPVPR